MELPFIYAFPFHDINDNEFLLTTSKLGKNKSLLELNEQTTESNCNRFALSEYSHSDYDNYINPDKKNFYNTINVDCSYYAESQFGFKTKNIKSSLSMIHFNARSLNANFENIKDYLYVLRHPFDVVVISETWIHHLNINCFPLQGYEAAPVNRDHKRGRGVAIYISKSIGFMEIKSMSSVVDNIMECVAIELKLNKRKHVIIGCIYRTLGSNVDIFNDTLELLLHKVKNAKKRPDEA